MSRTVRPCATEIQRRYGRGPRLCSESIFNRPSRFAGASFVRSRRRATAVASRLLGLDEMQTRMALGIAGVYICQRCEDILQVHDHPGIVWDEIVAFWLVLWLITPCGWLAQSMAFVLFRYFDIAKPGPVRWADQTFKGFGWRGGWGILFDDFVAAFCTLLVISLWRVL